MAFTARRPPLTRSGAFAGDRRIMSALAASTSLSGYESPEDLESGPPTPMSAPVGNNTGLPQGNSKGTANTSKTYAQRRDIFGSPPESLNGAVLRARKMAMGSRKVGVRERIGCFQWTWFTITMVRFPLRIFFFYFFFKKKRREKLFPYRLLSHCSVVLPYCSRQ